MITVFYRRKSPKQEVGRAETCVGDRRRLCDGTGQTNPFSATIRTQVTHSGVLSSFFLVAERRWGFEPHELRYLTTLRVLLTFLHKLCSHSSIKTALKLQKRSGIHSAYPDGGILPARSNQAMLCAKYLGYRKAKTRAANNPVCIFNETARH